MRKIVIRSIKKVDILFLDENYSNIKIHKFSSGYLKFDEINLFCLKFLIINFVKELFSLSFKDIYLKSIIEAYSPKIIIDHSINGRALRVKRFLKNIYCITYQHSFFYDWEKRTYKKRFKGTSCDLYITFSIKDTEFLSQFIKSKFISLGSLKNNEINLQRNNVKIPILLISEFRQKEKTLHYKKFKEITQLTRIFCAKNKIIPFVAINSMRKDKKKKISLEQEINFFKKYLRVFKWKKINNYKLSSQSKMTVALTSNLAVELLARGFKIALINLLGEAKKNNSIPYYKKKNTFFVLNSPKKKIMQKLDYIFYMENSLWKKKIKNFNHIIFDKDNKRFKTIIQNVITKS